MPNLTHKQYAAFLARGQWAFKSRYDLRTPAGDGNAIAAALQSERDLQQQIANYLRLRGIAFNQSRMDRRTTQKVGWPDFTFAVKRPWGGQAVALECKLPGQKPTDEQVRMMASLAENGWLVEIVTSLAEVKRLLDSMPA